MWDKSLSHDELVTVIIPVYNRERYLKDAIESVIMQTYRQWILIIVDDGSTDGTPEVAQAFLDDPRIQYVRFEDNRGAGAVLADALALVNTPYFVIVDSDDWLDIRALDILIHEMKRQDETTGLVFGNSITWSESEGHIRIKGIQGHRSFHDKYDFMLYHPIISPRFFRTEAVRAVGGFELDDPYGGRYMEDRYILLKLIEKYKFHYIEYPLYNQRLHSSNISGKQHQTQFEETRRYVYPKVIKQWGNEYEPVFYCGTSGWLHLQKLIPKSAHLPLLVADSSSPLRVDQLTTPKVTVVMPTYNRSDFIAEAIQSILSQDMTDWYLLIIDDASTDHTEAVVTGYLKDQRISYVRRPVNGGISQVLNDALKLVRTPYFMQLDPDDWVEPHTLSTLLSSMENASQDTALAYGNSILHRTEKDGTVTSTPHQHRSFHDKFDVLLYRWMVVPRFYRTAAVRQVGGWDLNVPFQGRYMEDRQMFYKLAEGYPLLYVDQLFYHYRLHGKNQTLTNIPKYRELRIYYMEHFFNKWNGRKEKNCVLEWKMNEGGWPQFSLVPVKQRMKYIYYLGALTRSHLTPRRMNSIIKRMMRFKRKNLQIVVFTLDNVDVESKYVRGFLLKDQIKGTKEESLFPLPNRSVYLHNDKMYQKVKRFARQSAANWILK